MIKNIGKFDRLLRIAVSIVFVVLIASETVTGTMAIVLGAAASIFMLTSVLGVCPLYIPLKINTNKK